MSVKIDRGAAAEYRFASECLGRGLVPNWPSVEGKPYDMILDTDTGRHKVQVKSTTKTGPSLDYQFLTKQSKTRRRYSKEEVDFIVLYLEYLDCWYIFPIDDVETAVRLKPGHPQCRWRIYLDAWHLITGKKEA